MQIKLVRRGQLKHLRPLHPSCLYNTQVDMIGIRDSNPKQISPTGMSWLGRKPENNNGSSQAVMLHRKPTEQIEDNVSEGYFVLVSEESDVKEHPTNICFPSSSFFSHILLQFVQWSARTSAFLTRQSRYHMRHFLTGLLKRYSTQVLLKLIIHQASFSLRFIITKGLRFKSDHCCANSGVTGQGLANRKR